MPQANLTLRDRLVAVVVELESLESALRAAGDQDLAAYTRAARLELRPAAYDFHARKVSDNALRR